MYISIRSINRRTYWYFWNRCSAASHFYSNSWGRKEEGWKIHCQFKIGWRVGHSYWLNWWKATWVGWNFSFTSSEWSIYELCLAIKSRYQVWNWLAIEWKWLSKSAYIICWTRMDIIWKSDSRSIFAIPYKTCLRK